MSTTLSLPAPAKLNLFLRILGRRPDGYHELQTLFQLLEFGDTVRLESLDDSRLTIDHMQGVPPEDNIALRAAQLLQARAVELGKQRGARIRIEKRLPMGGGLGGGSSDAASVLLGLNKLWALELELAELAALGLQLGADVPLFVFGRTSLGEGVGEQLRPVHTGPAWFVVLAPHVNIATASIFSNSQLTRDSHTIRIPPDFGCSSAPIAISNWPHDTGLPEGELGNDCEAVVRSHYPEVNTAISLLSQYGHAALTGTGSCVFAAFGDEHRAKTALQNMPTDISGFICEASNYSSAHRALGLY